MLSSSSLLLPWREHQRCAGDAAGAERGAVDGRGADDGGAGVAAVLVAAAHDAAGALRMKKRRSELSAFPGRGLKTNIRLAPKLDHEIAVEYRGRASAIPDQTSYFIQS